MALSTASRKRITVRYRRAERGAHWFVTLLILAGIVAAAVYIFPRYIAPRLGGSAPGSTVATSDGATCATYAGQIKAALKQYNDDAGRNPPTLATLNRYGITKDMLQDSACSFHYDPITGFHDLSQGEGSSSAMPASPQAPAEPGE